MTANDSTGPPQLHAGVRSRKIRLSSLHAGRRVYPKDRPPDLQISQFSSSESIANLLTPSSPDILPEHTSPTSPKFRRSRSRSLSMNDFRVIDSDSREFWIVAYFILNFSLTLCNKVVLNQFPFPYSVTAFHALGGCLGTWFIVRQEDKVPMLSTGEITVLVIFSVLYTVNIAVSNVSLQLVTVPFHQVVRSSSPFFTLALSSLLLQTPITPQKLISLVPVIAGVGLATYGDYYYTLSGFLLTLSGTFLASLKTVITNALQSPMSQSRYAQRYPRVHLQTHEHKKRTSISITAVPFTSVTSEMQPSSLFASIPRLHLTSVQLLYLISPLALFQCTLLAFYFGEIDQIVSRVRSSSSSRSNIISGDAPTSPIILPSIFGILLNTSMAFALNIVSFHTNRKVGALGMSVAANVKQVLTVLSSVVLFNLTITRTNAVGILLTLIGGGWYAKADVREKEQQVRITA